MDVLDRHLADHEYWAQITPLLIWRHGRGMALASGFCMIQPSFAGTDLRKSQSLGQTDCRAYNGGPFNRPWGDKTALERHDADIDAVFDVE